jgi:hypothetical protein
MSKHTTKENISFRKLNIIKLAIATNADVSISARRWPQETGLNEIVGIGSASGTDAGVLREFGEHGSPPQNRVAHASATLSDSPIPKIAFGDFSRASSIPTQQGA